MLDERSLSDQTYSLDYCESRYLSYGLFATLPLRTAVVETGVYKLQDFEYAFEWSGENHGCNLPLSEFINSLTYDDKDYFTVEETRFMLQFIGFCEPITDKQLEADRKALSREARQGKNILKSHARILLKALEFWKLRYNDKYVEWEQKFRDADQAWITRRMIENGFLDANGNPVDEGYGSDSIDFEGEHDEEM